MADEKQLKILQQGVAAWNKWRGENENVEIDLANVDLWGTDLIGVNLSRAWLSSASLINAKLCKANLSGIDLTAADLRGADLDEANLTKAFMWETDLTGARLRKTILNEIGLGFTVFATVDLSETFGLDDLSPDSPSIIGADTLRLSKGKIPEAFLRGCGLSDWEIESAKLYNPDLTNDEIVKIQYRIYELRATQALQISPLFISYSHADKTFVDKIDKALTKNGVRFWRDIHDATAGRLETQIDRAMRLNPTVLLVLSENSIKSDWVEHEVRTARELEKELGRDALCPIALDNCWKSSPWPKRVMEQIMEYNILDFSKWEDESTFEEKFAKLLNGLDLFYKKPAK